jgi:hypothetical protein
MPFQHKFYITLIFLCSTYPFTGFAQQEADNNAFFYYSQAMQAYEEKNYPQYLSHLSKIAGPDTRQPGLLYQMAAAHALNNNHQDAFAYLSKLSAMGLAYPIATDPDFTGFRQSEKYGSILKAFEKNNINKHPGIQAFRLTEKDLIPEGITYDPVENKWYIGSIYKRKVISVDAKGKVSNFTAEGQNGLYGVLGMKTDPKRRELWVCSAALAGDTSGASAIFKYDLATKKLLKKYLLAGDTQKHLLNDLVITSSGDVFATNSESGGVYTIARNKDQLEELIKPGTFIYPNGIALSANEKSLFIAHFAGISSVSLENRQVKELPCPDNTTIAGIDGLYLYKDHLLAVQNGVEPQRIIKITLNSLQNAVTGVNILEAGHPLFEKIPTTGVVAGGFFYFIANSQLRSIGEKGTILPHDQLQEPVILKLKLE